MFFQPVPHFIVMATCNLCNATEQTLSHLLTNCVTMGEFWTLFQNWWREKTSEIIKLSASHIFYGWFDGTKHWQVLNYCLLIAKHSIFCRSLRGDELNFQNFLLLIQEKLEILKEVPTETILRLVIIANRLFSFNYPHFDALN